MSANSRITNAYENAFCLPLNPSSKYVLLVTATAEQAEAMIIS